MFVKANAFAHSIRVVVSLRSQRTGSRALLAFVGGRGKGCGPNFSDGLFSAKTALFILNL